jgi:SDR family mycofactocin-dependent oxidoreductase
VLVDRCSDDPSLQYALATEAEFRETCAACGGDAQTVGVIGDVREQRTLDEAVAKAVEHFGGVDAAVAVAGGIAGGQPAWHTEDAVWDAMFDVNFLGVRRLAAAAIPIMLERTRPRHGRFLAVSSAGGMLGLPLLAGYSAAKHAVIGFVKSLAAELGSEGITANAVAPGSTSTEMLHASAAVYGLASPDDFITHHLLGRLVEPDEVAALLAWLCGTDSDAITGAVLPVDAGMTAS